MAFDRGRGLVLGLAVFVVLGLALGGWWAWRWADGQSGTASQTTDIHAAYGQLYDAAWRQDDGRGSEVFTATLLAPRLRELLQADTQRTDTDQQLARLLRDIELDIVPLVITMDAVVSSPSARLTDVAVERSLRLTAVGVTFELIDLQPLITPTTISNSNVTTARRMWLMAWRSDPAINWETVRDLQLEIRDLGQTKLRTLTWARPAALVDEPG